MCILILAMPFFIIFCVLDSTLAGKASTYQDTLLNATFLFILIFHMYSESASLVHGYINFFGVI